jgi:hypothetical protein
MAWTERYVTPLGAGANNGTSEANAWTLAQAFSGMAAGQRLNVKAGTYSIGASLSPSFPGTSSAPMAIRGYKTTIGDLDSQPITQRVSGTDTPLFSTSGGDFFLNFTGTNVESITNINFLTTVNARPALYLQCTVGRVVRCRFRHNGSAPSSQCLYTIATPSYFEECYFYINSTSQSLVKEGSAVNMFFDSCVFVGGNVGVSGSTEVINALHCIFNGQSASAMLVSSGRIVAENCTIYNTVDGLKATSSSASINAKRCYFSTISGYAINNSSGTSVPFVVASECAYYSVTARANGASEFADQYAVTDSTNPFVNTATGDFTLLSSSNAASGEILFECAGPTTTRSIGAVQSGGSGGTSGFTGLSGLTGRLGT